MADSRSSIAVNPDAGKRLVRYGSLLFILTLAGNICNYLFQLYMSRALDVADFGTLNAVLAMATILLAPAGVIMMAVSRKTAEMKALGRAAALGFFLRRVFIAVAAGSAGIFALIFLAGPWISGYMVLASVWPIALAGGIVATGWLVPVNLGLFQGIQAFVSFGVFTGLNGFLRLGAGIALIWMGGGLLGALGASVLSNVVILGATTVLVLGMLKGSAVEDLPGRIRLRRIVESVAPIAAGTFLFTVLTNIDVILVKHFFGESEAGQYAAAAVLGRAMLYFPTAISMALYPMVAEARALGKGSMRILRKSLVLTAVLTLFALGIYLLFPRLLITTLLGTSFAPAAPLVPLFGLAMAPFTLAYVVMNFDLAGRRARFLIPYALTCVAEIALITAVFHDTREEVLTVMVLSGFGVLVAGLLGLRRGRGGIGDG
jgi:O-antigen/teichoic acid export membrane protein